MNRIKSYLTLALLLLSLSCAAQTSSVNIGVMLPLHNVNGDGRRMVEYYRGMLMAVEQLKSEGISVNVHAWNLAEGDDPRLTLLKDGATSCNVIFGPLYSKQVKAVADFCRAYGIRLVIPFSINSDEVNRNASIYQVYESPDDINTASIQRIAENFQQTHCVFIDCADSTSRKGAFTFALRKVLERAGRQYNITALHSSDESFAKAFTLTQPNLVILNTGRMPELRKAIARLDALRAANQNLQVVLYGYTDWLMYERYLRQDFCRYDAYVPANFYYNAQAPAVQAFEQKYRWRFHADMQQALPRFALTGYDHVMALVAGRTTWLQTPLKFEKQSAGGYRNRAFMLLHYKQDGSIDAIHY